MEQNNIISLRNADGKEMKFEKVASVALSGKSYAVLAPIEKLPGMPENSALVFEVQRDGDNARLNIVTDSEEIERVYSVYAAQKLAETEEQARA